MNTSSQNQHRDLHILHLSEVEKLAGLSVKPTVCLIASDSLGETAPLARLLDVLASIGCQFFLTWGSAAEAIHDRLDELIEQQGGEALEIATMSQNDETADDVAWFLLNAAIPGQADTRYVVVIDRSLAEEHLLVSAIRLPADQA